ncbi:hypothetical protein PENTCL1PPCAC_28720, partial [Pristionchus entomophagus]
KIFKEYPAVVSSRDEKQFPFPDLRTVYKKVDCFRQKDGEPSRCYKTMSGLTFYMGDWSLGSTAVFVKDNYSKHSTVIFPEEIGVFVEGNRKSSTYLFCAGERNSFMYFYAETILEEIKAESFSPCEFSDDDDPFVAYFNEQADLDSDSEEYVDYRFRYQFYKTVVRDNVYISELIREVYNEVEIKFAIDQPYY